MHRRLLSLTRDTRASLTLTILSGFLAGLLTIWQAWNLSSVVNGVFLQKLSLEQVTTPLILMLLAISGRTFLTWVNEVASNAVAVKIKTDLRERLFAHILKLGPAYSRGQRTGELTTAAVEGIEALDAYFSQYLPQLVITALVPISILFFVFPIDLLTGLVFLITAPLIPFFMIIIGKGAETVTKRQYETLRLLSAHFLDSLQGLTTLKLFGQSKGQAKNIAKVSEQYRDTTLERFAHHLPLRTCARNARHHQHCPRRRGDRLPSALPQHGIPTRALPTRPRPRILHAPTRPRREIPCRHEWHNGGEADL
jgi:ATP-binding cassette, subfamily C, bacterial CydD